jgi:hypothetical protein
MAPLPRIFSVATRLPPEFRLTPNDAVQLLQEEVFTRLKIHDLPPAARVAMLPAAAHDGIAGGRIYDATSRKPRGAGASVIVTDNRRHFLFALRYDMRVETPAEFLDSIKPPRPRRT